VEYQEYALLDPDSQANNEGDPGKSICKLFLSLFKHRYCKNGFPASEKIRFAHDLMR
jgi:hypothetical protein